MLQIDELDESILEKIILKEEVLEEDFEKYYIESFTTVNINIKYISVVINYKSKESEKEFTVINGMPVSMDIILVKTISLKISDYNKYLRNKKLKKLISSVLISS